MRLFRFLSASGRARLGLETGARRLDLTEHLPETFGSLAQWLAAPDPLAKVRNIAGQNDDFSPVPDDARWLAPVDEQEIWAAGVTYERSKTARMEESAGGGDFYDKVYDAARPELFFKALPHRVAGPNDPIRIRRDSRWDVPEPEMTLVLSSTRRIVGVTIGNDVSSRQIEGENPLYLPQAKMYEGACALGPAILLLDDTIDLSHLSIQLRIDRAGQIVFSGETSTARMKRTPEELVDYLFRELNFPGGALLMTGTGIVPPDDFTLRPGDVVSITIPDVGTLSNLVQR